MKFHILIAATFLLASAAEAGDLSGQARGLDGVPVRDVTVIVVNANNEVIRQQTFRDGRFTLNIPDGRLFAGNVSVSLLFSAPGRDDARLDNIAGNQIGQQVDIILPLKIQAKPEPENYPARCRLFRFCRRH